MTSDPSSNDDTTAYPRHTHSIPYTSPPNPLQTLDIHQYTAPDSLPSSAPWLIYIHGGAWRDPLQDSRCIEPTLRHLVASYPHTLSTLGGIASLNYRLSAYPTHPTHPSTPSDVSRNAVHPAHVRDVSAAIAYLARHHGVRRWIGVGHSCGATLLLQHVSRIGLESRDTPGPAALVLLAGIYNLPLLLRNHVPPACSEEVAGIYRSLVAGAFGGDEGGGVYQEVSPVSGRYDGRAWPEGRLMVVCHSYEDELVERAQRDVLCVAMDRQGWSIVMEDGDEEDEVAGQEERRVLNVRDVKGAHDWVWEDGEQIARLVAEVVERLG